MTSITPTARLIKFDEIQVGDLIEYKSSTPLIASGGYWPLVSRVVKLLALSQTNGVWRAINPQTNVFHYLSKLDIDSNIHPAVLLSRAEVM